MVDYLTNRKTGNIFVSGVYGLNKQTRPGQVDFQSLFEVPGSDLDFIQERNGKFIVVEFKKKGEAPLTSDDGQRILLEALARLPNFTVVIYTHDENYEGTGQILSGVPMPITSKAKLQLYTKLWRQRVDGGAAR
jgi:hypothetical protein